MIGADNIWLAIPILDRPKGLGGARSFPCPGDPVAGLPEASQSGEQPTGRQESAAITSSLGLDHLPTPAYSSLVSILRLLPRPSRLLLSPSVFLLLWLQRPVFSLMDKHPLQGDLPPDATPSEPLSPGHLHQGMPQGPWIPQAPKEPLGFLSPDLPLQLGEGSHQSLTLQPVLGPQEPTLPPPPSLIPQPAAHPAFLPPHISLNCPLSSIPLPSLTWTTAMALSPPVTEATLTSWAHTSTPLPHLQRLTPRDGPAIEWALNSTPGFQLSSWLPASQHSLPPFP